MTTQEAKNILEQMRPQRPQKDVTKQQQMAIDIATHCIDFYNDYMELLRGSKG